MRAETLVHLGQGFGESAMLRIVQQVDLSSSLLAVKFKLSTMPTTGVQSLYSKTQKNYIKNYIKLFKNTKELHKNNMKYTLNVPVSGSCSHAEAYKLEEVHSLGWERNQLNMLWVAHLS